MFFNNNYNSIPICYECSKHISDDIYHAPFVIRFCDECWVTCLGKVKKKKNKKIKE